MANLPSAAQIGHAVECCRTPNVVSERSVQFKRIRPLCSVRRGDAVSQVQVHFQVFARERGVAAIPGTRIDKQLVLKFEEMWITRIPFWHTESMNLFPRPQISAAQDNDRCVWANAMPVRA